MYCHVVYMVYAIIKYFVKSSYEISKDGVNSWHDSFA